MVRKASPVNIHFESIPMKPTRVANDHFLPDLLVRNDPISERMDQRSSSSQTQRTTKNLLPNTSLLYTVSVLPTMPIRVANHPLLPEKNLYIC